MTKQKVDLRFEYFFCGGKQWVLYLDNMEVNCGDKAHLRNWAKREFGITNDEYKTTPIKKVVAFQTRTIPHNQPHKPMRY